MIDKNSLIILELSKRPETGGILLFSRWFFGLDLLPKQFVFHHADTPNVTLLGGIGSGKTTAVALSLFCHAATIPHFRGLNTSITSAQAELPFRFLERYLESEPRLRQLVVDVVKRPYPAIHLFNGSELSFRTAGYEARNIRGFEYDRINYDEGGYEFRDLTLKALRGRLRGRRPDGSLRMARLDVTTTPTDTPWLIQRWNSGDPMHESYDPKRFTSIRITTHENTFLSSEQIQEIIADYSDELIRVEVMAEFPDYGEGEFSRSAIEGCTDFVLNDLMEDAIRSGRAGYVYVEHPRHGCLHWEEPHIPGRTYIIAGDPGTGAPPRRNAAVVLGFDVSEVPYRLVYFHWIGGGGSYTPFLESFKYAMEKYRPIFKAMDTTGTQKAIDELAFRHLGLRVDSINFVREKDAMLNKLKMLLNERMLRFPFIKGMIHQLRTYRRRDEKIPQDIVSAMMEIAHLVGVMGSSQEVGAFRLPRASSRRSRGRRVSRR